MGAGSDRAARVWSLRTGRILHTFTGHASKIFACRLSADGKTAVTGGTDRKAMVWDVHTGFKIRTLSCECCWLRELNRLPNDVYS